MALMTVQHPHYQFQQPQPQQDYLQPSSTTTAAPPNDDLVECSDVQITEETLEDVKCHKFTHRWTIDGFSQYFRTVSPPENLTSTITPATAAGGGGTGGHRGATSIDSPRFEARGMRDRVWRLRLLSPAVNEFDDRSASVVIDSRYY